jgi:hypothetical protein
MRSEIDQAYYERNKLVRFLASLFPAGIAKTDIPGWEPEWHNCVYIDTPEGQLSWHYHDEEAHLFSALPPYEKPWDGHSTLEKYLRLERLTVRRKNAPEPDVRDLHDKWRKTVSFYPEDEKSTHFSDIYALTLEAFVAGRNSK